MRQASGQAGDGQKGSICALSQNDTAPSDCSSPFWCRQAEVPPLHGSGYGWCTDEAKTAVNHAPGTAAMSSSVSLNTTPPMQVPMLLVTDMPKPLIRLQVWEFTGASGLGCARILFLRHV